MIASRREHTRRSAKIQNNKLTVLLSRSSSSLDEGPMAKHRVVSEHYSSY